MHTITVLHVRDCTGGRVTLESASNIAHARADVAISDVLIEGEADAVSMGFRGSPTVLIDGRDIEPDSQTPIGSMG